MRDDGNFAIANNSLNDGKPVGSNKGLSDNDRIIVDGRPLDNGTFDTTSREDETKDRLSGDVLDNSKNNTGSGGDNAVLNTTGTGSPPPL